MKQRKALGRGLGALIPGTPGDDANASSDALKTVLVNRIRPNPKQPRKQFDDDELEELAATIGDIGLMQPIVVRPAGENFEIISGERRWRASQLAGLESVPIIVREATEQEVLAMSLIENLQRVNLNPLEEAEGYRRLINEFGLKQDEVAKSVGKDRSTVTNLLRLLKLTAPVQALLRESKISMGHARSLAAIEDAGRQQALARRVVDKELSVRQLENLIRSAGEAPKSEKRKAPVDPNLRDVIDKLKRSFGTKVSLSGSEGKGKLVFEFYSPEEFERLLEKLMS